MILNEDKILILDGAMGTMIQRYGLKEEDYRGTDFADCTKELRGNNECLNLTHPEVIKEIHNEYIAAGADIIETNTFSANRISQKEYDCGHIAPKMAYEGARIAREAADEAAAIAAKVGLSRKVWVAGSMGPTSKSLSLSPDIADPAFRPYSFDQMVEAYREQAEALLKGGADLLLIETCFDALNVKAALTAVHDICRNFVLPKTPAFASLRHPLAGGGMSSSASNIPTKNNNEVPVMISVSVGDRSGRTLTGQTLEAFHTAVSHYPIIAFGLNCSLGASELLPLIEEVNRWCGCGVSCYPNAGLPNEMGGYDQTPEEMAGQIRVMAEKGLLNIVGGCCGTTPDHIRAIAKSVQGIRPRTLSGKTCDFPDNILKVSGLEATEVDVKKNNFINVGERTNVAGSRKFARLVAEGKYDDAIQIAAKQIEDGATIIDINMDDAMLDSTREMERFVRYISNDPAVAKAALMIDSSHWETILAGLKNAQGKCIVNSISLKEGEEEFIRKAQTIKSLGAAMVVMAFDENGQATTYDRKIQICERAYRILTEKAGISPENIIFDVNILSIGTGIDEHAKYAVDFIEAVWWIKSNLPGALTSGGVSNLSFAFRGNNAVREAMHSAFLYHAIKAGLDMAILNPSMLQVYDDIEPELLECVEDVIFDRDAQATERLIDKASRMLDAAQSPRIANDGPATTGTSSATESEAKNLPSAGERLQTALVRGRTDNLEKDLSDAMEQYGSALDVIEGPLMAGMETVGSLFGEGKMFLPQVVKSAKVMRDAVEILQPQMIAGNQETIRPKVVIATVKGDVHDIGKNITGIVLTCNGFDVHDLGVMVDKETILSEADRIGADIIAVSGLITPSLYQMEELCRTMAESNMKIPLFIGGATTSALHTAVKLAPLYDHVFYGADASASAVLAKKCMMDRGAFEAEQHAEQALLRTMYDKGGNEEPTISQQEDIRTSAAINENATGIMLPDDIILKTLTLEDVMPYFDWRMFYAIWGVRYGSQVPEAMELIQLRQDAENELAMRNFKIMISARFMEGAQNGDDIVFISDGCEKRLPMMRQETGRCMSLCDFLPEISGDGKSPFGVFAVSVHQGRHHEEGCSCPACANRYEDLVGKTVRMTLAEAASKWLDAEILRSAQDDRGETQDDRGKNHNDSREIKVIKPAAGYASCPDHTLKKDILELLGENVRASESVHHHDCHHDHHHSSHHGECQDPECGCRCEGLGISLTESYAMTPESSICGMIFIHPDASYPEIRRISEAQYEDYAHRRGMEADTARRFLGHLLK